MAPPNGIPVYNQIQVHPFTDKISAPNPMAGFRTAPDAVMWSAAHKDLDPT